MTDGQSETRECPFCKEEVKAAAIRCKHCLANISGTRPDHGGVCPFCREDIKVDATRCMHCKAGLVASARAIAGRGRPPMRITTRRPMSDPTEPGTRRISVRPADLRAPVVARADSSPCSGCPPFISTDYGTYHLVDCGQHDGWNYCGYEPGYGVFEDDDFVPTTLRS